ncbi:MAG TPA: hypothetical protein VE553_03065 [Candidatus Binatia bacterium]|nr:hypothetical protein [Candidatus Binatia bacterium]
MNTATNIARGLVGITGLIQITTGLLFWMGYVLSLIPIHMLSGLILSISLLVLAILGARAGVNRGFVTLAIVWSFLTPALGIMQTQLLPGSMHWLIRVIHLLVGLAAMSMGHRLALRIQSLQAPEPAAS